MRLFFRAGVASARDFFFSDAIAGTFHGFTPSPEGVTLKCTPESEARTFESVDYEVYGRLGGIDADITVIASTDGAPPATIAPMVAEGIGSARLVTWEGETHFGPFTHPARAAVEIRDNLR